MEAENLPMAPESRLVPAYHMHGITAVGEFRARLPS